jgi:hypothetical protein
VKLGVLGNPTRGREGGGEGKKLAAPLHTTTRWGTFPKQRKEKPTKTTSRKAFKILLSQIRWENLDFFSSPRKDTQGYLGRNFLGGTAAQNPNLFLSALSAFPALRP